MSHTIVTHFSEMEAARLVGRRVTAHSAKHAYGIENGTRGQVTAIISEAPGKWAVQVRWDVPRAEVLGRRVPLVDVFQRFDYERYLR